MKQTRLIGEAKATKSDILGRLAAAFEVTLHYFKRDHRQYLFIRELAKQHPENRLVDDMVKQAKEKRETLRAEARRLRWIASDRSLSERRREDRAKARHEARNAESNT